MIRQRPRYGLIVLACLLVATAGCSGVDGVAPMPSSLACPATTGGPLTLVVGARANSPAPQVPDEIKSLVVATAEQGAPIQVVRVDGGPSVALSATFSTDTNSDVARQSDIAAFTARVVDYIMKLTPKQPEADVLAALTTAAGATRDGGTIVLLDSGLATNGQLSFRESDMFAVEPDDAAKYLLDQHQMPNLTRRSVVLVGLGSTADPQPALDQNLHDRVVGLWRTIATKAGASCVQDLDIPLGRTSIQTSLPVAVVPLPLPPSFEPCGTTVLADTDTVGFLPDEAVFRDPLAAKATLQGLADQLAEGSQLVTLTGTTASSGPVQARMVLSQQRADAVRDILASLGVDPNRIRTFGAGSNGPNHVTDIGPDGSLLPGPAAHNRSVVVEISCAAK